MPKKQTDINRYEPLRITSTLIDNENPPKTVLHIAEIEFEENAIVISVKGFSTKGMMEDGAIIVIEVWNGELRILCWPDINTEDPMIISMEKAKEEYREDDEHQHEDHEDCMTCAECHRCQESLDSDDICSSCRED